MNEFNSEIVTKALKFGIMLKDENGFYKKAPGFIALVFFKEFNEFVLTYGFDKTNAGYVLVKDIDKTWNICNS